MTGHQQNNEPTRAIPRTQGVPPNEQWVHDPHPPIQHHPPRTNVLAIISLVASLSTVIIGFGFIVGIVTGHIAMRQINETGESGKGLAKAGLIIGYISLAITLLAVFVILAGVLVAAQAPSF